MLGKAVLTSYLKWLHSVKKNLVCVRGGQGSQVAESLDRLGVTDNLVRALRSIDEILPILERFTLSGRWKRKIKNKCEIWKQVIVSTISREGIETPALQEMLMSGEMSLEGALAVGNERLGS